ncbi:MAG: hypothetical protein MK108_14305 [Mariniblastus sp.]|nr:hypothetical protein [Mariniblastus sp.]
MDDQWQQDYDCLLRETGFLELNGWTVIRLTGTDRCSFLNSFCTADIVAMDIGQVREAFVLNGKGKTIGHVQVLNLPDCLMLVGAGEQASALLPHLEMYIIREDVQLEDCSADTDSYLVAGPQSAETLTELLPAVPEPGRCLGGNVEGETDTVVALGEFAGECFWLAAPAEKRLGLARRLEGAGCHPVSAVSIEMLRLSQGTPWFGCETTADNLPQELNRDEKTISFNKGCYLGQETVARIDSLGRVNQLLVTLDFGEAEPDVGQELVLDGKRVGRVTSVAPAGERTGWRALAFVKRDLAQVGTEIGPARVEA